MSYRYILETISYPENFPRVVGLHCVQSNMKKHTIDQLIHAERARELPTCPGNLEANVLRRIRLSRRDAVECGNANWLPGLLPCKGAVLGALALVLFLSTSASVFVATRHAEATSRVHLASNSLDFEVFEPTHILNFD